jgi:hypothetical protein
MKSPLLSFADICEDSDAIREAQEMLLSLSPPQTLRESSHGSSHISITPGKRSTNAFMQELQKEGALQNGGIGRGVPADAGIASMSVSLLSNASQNGVSGGDTKVSSDICQSTGSSAETSTSQPFSRILPHEVSNDSAAGGLPTAPNSDSLLGPPSTCMEDGKAVDRAVGGSLGYSVVNSEDTNLPCGVNMNVKSKVVSKTILHDSNGCAEGNAGSGTGTGHDKSRVTNITPVSAMTSSEEGSGISRSASVSPKMMAESASCGFASTDRVGALGAKSSLGSVAKPSANESS